MAAASASSLLLRRPSFSQSPPSSSCSRAGIASWRSAAKQQLRPFLGENVDRLGEPLLLLRRRRSSSSSSSSRDVSVKALFQFGKKKAAPKVVRETVIPEPDYRISVVLLGAAGALAYGDNLLPAAPIGLLGLLLLFQTTRVRFVFDDEGLEVKVGNEMQESGENVFIGGKNRWSYSSFTNWEFWWPNFPVLVYFKETQTKPEGQIHFFPVIFNGKQLYDVMVERAGPSKTSGP